MSLQSIITTFTERLWDQRDKSVIDELFSPDFAGYNLSDVEADAQPLSLDDFRGKITELFDAFPAMQFVLDETIEQGNRAALRWHSDGVWSGAYGDHPPTQQAVRLAGVFIIHVDNGLIKQAYIIDTARSLDQLA